MTGPPARVLSGVCVEMNPLMLVPTALRRAGGMTDFRIAASILSGDSAR